MTRMACAHIRTTESREGLISPTCLYKLFSRCVFSTLKLCFMPDTICQRSPVLVLSAHLSGDIYSSCTKQVPKQLEGEQSSQPRLEHTRRKHNRRKHNRRKHNAVQRANTSELRGGVSSGTSVAHTLRHTDPRKKREKLRTWLGSPKVSATEM